MRDGRIDEYSLQHRGLAMSVVAWIQQIKTVPASLTNWGRQRLTIGGLSPVVSHIVALLLGVASALVLVQQTPQFGQGIQPGQAMFALRPNTLARMPDRTPTEGIFALLRAANGGGLQPVCRISNAKVVVTRTRPLIVLRGPLGLAGEVEPYTRRARPLRGGGESLGLVPGAGAQSLPLCTQQFQVSYGTDDT